MHRIWSIPEMVEAIISCLPGSEGEGKENERRQKERLQTLALLARTARFLFKPAVRQLWANVSVLQLVRRLEKVVEGANRERVVFYAQQVRSLGIPFAHDDYSNHLEDYQYLLSSQDPLHQLLEAKLAFPRLSRLFIHMEQFDVNDEMHDLFHTLGRKWSYIPRWTIPSRTTISSRWQSLGHGCNHSGFTWRAEAIGGKQHSPRKAWLF